MHVIRYKDRPIWHETGLIDSGTGRPYLVAESPANLLIRLKGTRQALSLPWNLAYLRAATLAAAMVRLNKINKRRTVRRGALVS
jgi:hypothetical protein